MSCKVNDIYSIKLYRNNKKQVMRITDVKGFM